MAEQVPPDSSMFFSSPRDTTEQWLESIWKILVNHEHRICKLEGEDV